MGHPLLDQDQAHSVVNEFNRFGVTKRMEAKVEEITLLITDPMGDCQVIETISNASISKGITMEEAMAFAHPFRGRKQPSMRVFLRSVVLFYPRNLRLDHRGNLLANGNSVPQDMCFLNVTNETIFLVVLCQAALPLEGQDIRDAPSTCSEHDHHRNVQSSELVKMAV